MKVGAVGWRGFMTEMVTAFSRIQPNIIFTL